MESTIEQSDEINTQPESTLGFVYAVAHSGVKRAWSEKQWFISAGFTGEEFETEISEDLLPQCPAEIRDLCDLLNRTCEDRKISLTKDSRFITLIPRSTLLDDDAVDNVPEYLDVIERESFRPWPFAIRAGSSWICYTRLHRDFHDAYALLVEIFGEPLPSRSEVLERRRLEAEHAANEKRIADERAELKRRKTAASAGLSEVQKILELSHDDAARLVKAIIDLSADPTAIDLAAEK